MTDATKDINGNLHAAAGTIGGGGKFVQKLTDESGMLPAPVPTALDNPVLAKLRGDAAAAKLDSDMATADAIKQYVRDTFPGATTLTMFKDEDQDESGYDFESLTDSEGNEIESFSAHATLERSIIMIDDENLYALGADEWIEDDDDFNAHRGTRLTINLADEPNIAPAALNVKDLTHGYGPLHDAITTAIDRGNIPEEAILGLDYVDVEDLYDRHMGNAIDKIEHDLLDPVFLVGEH